MKVLVVDDSPEITEVVSLCFQLRWPDTEVVSASDGIQGLKMVETERPDIVILDVGLPGMDGFQVLRELRRLSQVPVIMLTVRGEDIDVARGLEFGADDYVRKPFSHVELMARVQAVLRRVKGVSVRGCVQKLVIFRPTPKIFFYQNNNSPLPPCQEGVDSRISCLGDKSFIASAIRSGSSFTPPQQVGLRSRV